MPDDDDEWRNKSKELLGWWYGILNTEQSVEDNFEFAFPFMRPTSGREVEEANIYSGDFYRGWIRDSASCDFWRSEGGEELLLYFNNENWKEDEDPIENTYYLEITPLAVLTN
jgi:hypothetical protein